MMESALIVSSTEKGTEFFTGLLSAAAIARITATGAADEARGLLLERDYDLVIVNAPLRDESGEGLSRYIAAKGVSQVMLFVNAEYSDALSDAFRDDGVLVMSKPVNKAVFRAVLSLTETAWRYTRRIFDENTKLKQKIEDIRIIDRAKWLLVSQMGMNEQEAHRYIEKHAMDMRTTRRAVAEGVLKTYEN